MLEEEKTAIRLIRRESREAVEKLEKDKAVTEDDKFHGFDKIQEAVDDATKKIEEMAAAKEKEILGR
jgi:ribosome recycling factor